MSLAEATPRGGTPYTRLVRTRRTPRRRPPVDPERAAAELRRRLTIGSRIREARARLGISQQQFALLVDMERGGHQRISQWENGRAGMCALTLERLAAAVGEPIHYFYGGPSAHELPVEQDPDPWVQPDAAMAAIGELLQVLDRVGLLLDRLGRAGVMIDARLETLRTLGLGPPA